MKRGISASLMCVDFYDTKKDLLALQEAAIDYLHFDIMDGSFVPNYALGPCMAGGLRGKTGIPFDFHLMVDRPEDKLKFFDLQPGDAVSVHAESTVHMQRVLSYLRDSGVYTGAALNPATSIDALRYVLDVIDFVLIMTVNPGYAGQSLVAGTIGKISDTRKYLDERGAGHVLIEVDGNVSFENAKKMRRAGADIFVAGTAGLFRKDMPIVEAAGMLRQIIK